MDEIPGIFSQNFRVRYGEIDAQQRLQPFYLFHYLQEIAFNHADMLAQAVEGKAEWEAAVVWTRMKLVLHSLPKWKDEITFSTWISPMAPQDKFAFRNFAFSDHEHRELGYGFGSLLFFDLKTRSAAPVPEAMKRYPTDPKFQDRHHFSNFHAEIIPITDNTVPSERNVSNQLRSVGYLDIDPYHHVNNVKYLEWAMQAVDPPIFEQYTLKTLEIYFLKELRLNQMVHVQTEYIAHPDQLEIQQLIYRANKNQKIAQIQTFWQKNL